MPMMFHGYFDESGKWKDKDTVSFCGWTARADIWEEFSRPWLELLAEVGISELHTSEFCSLSGAYSRLRKDLKQKDVESILLRFADIIQKTVAMGYAVAVDAKHLRRMKPHFQNELGNPHYLAFKLMMNQVMQDISFVQTVQTVDLRVGIICDQDPGTSDHCLKWFNKFRQSNEKARHYLSGICFADASGAIPLQAADLFAYAVRLEAERRRTGTPNEPSQLFQTLSNRIQPDGKFGTYIRGHILDANFLDIMESGKLDDQLTAMGIVF